MVPQITSLHETAKENRENFTPNFNRFSLLSLFVRVTESRRFSTQILS